ncbi:MAG: extracellular solute-binding protein [Acidimicrobiales bacterium]|nr:extracellular solute-binding protein [Acidimicrobiales bacterium]
MRKPWVIRLVGLFAVLMLIASACGDDDDDDTTPTTTPSDGATTTMSDGGGMEGAPCDGEIDGPLTLTLTAHSSEPAYTDSVAAFNAGPGADLGITVELIDLGESAYEDFIQAAAASDDLPDIIDMDGPFLYNFAWNGFVQPLGNCVPDGKLADFLPSIIEQGMYNDELYSLGSFDSGMGIWAKRSALEGIDARIPETSEDAWTAEEFDQILRDLEASGIDSPLDIKWWYGAGEWRPYGFATIVQSAGGDIIDRTDFQSADGKLNSPEAVAAMTQFQTWAEDGLIDLDAVDDNNFITGDVPLSWVGHWMYGDYKAALGDDLVLVPLPDFGTGSKAGMGSWNWAMSTEAADPDAVWAFIDFVTSPDQVKTIADAESAVPSLKSVLDADPTFQPGGDRYLYVLNLEAAPDVALPRPATPAYGAIRNAFSDALADIVTGADVQETLDNAVAEIDDDIEANEGYPIIN